MRYVSDLHRRTPSRLGGEEGSLLFALLAILIIAAMVSALFVRTVSGQRAARFDRDFQEVVHHADAGVQQALFMLETDEFVDVEPGQRRPADPSDTFTAEIDGNEAQWFIERVNSRTWEVTSTSAINGVSRTVVATLEEQRLFFASAFAQQLAEFNNQNYADTYKSNKSSSPFGEDGPYWPRPGLLGIVGSNEEVKLGGSSSQVDGVQLWDFDESETVASRCTGSGNTKIGLTMSAHSTLKNPDYDPDGELTACEADAFVRPEDSLLGAYSSTFARERPMVPTNVDLQNFLGEEGGLESCGERPYPDFNNEDKASASHRTITTLEPVTDANASTLEEEQTGTNPRPPYDVAARELDGEPGFKGPGERYYCFNNVTFGQDTTLASTEPNAASAEQPVVIFATGKVDVKGNSRKVNCVNCPNTYFTDGPEAAQSPPVASALQIYLVSIGDVPLFHQSPSSQFGGTMYGPEAECGNTGSSQAEVYGSMICGTINITGGWKFHYDDALTGIGNGDFVVATWREETG